MFEPAVPDRKRMVEWRGTIMRGRFTPFAVIVRLRWPEETKSFLAIYRLRDDGTSCIVGETEGSNEAARAIADRSLTTFKCSEEPQVR